jgi:hypothetical protein
MSIEARSFRRGFLGAEVSVTVLLLVAVVRLGQTEAYQEQDALTAREALAELGLKPFWLVLLPTLHGNIGPESLELVKTTVLAGERHIACCNDITILDARIQVAKPLQLRAASVTDGLLIGTYVFRYCCRWPDLF